jgi:hypothetical protein
MIDILEKRLPLSQIYEEFNMSPARDPHNNIVGEIYHRLRLLLDTTEFAVKHDTFRYLDDWLINAFGDFKNLVNLENFVAGLTRFGASKKFIQSKLDEYSGVGTAPMGYAPDVFIVEKAERNNEFAVPVVVFEVISAQSRQHDLFYKPYFYETIGVRECFICEPSLEAGTIIRAYRAENKIYQSITLEDDRYFSEAIGKYLPKVWKL